MDKELFCSFLLVKLMVLFFVKAQINILYLTLNIFLIDD